MSNVHIALCEVRAYSANGQRVEVPDARLIGTPEVIASSGTTQQATLTATVGTNIRRTESALWRIANCGTDHVYAVFGSNPAPASIAAAAGTGYAVPAGAVCYFKVNINSEKVAIINTA